jgi:hypothetical protein
MNASAFSEAMNMSLGRLRATKPLIWAGMLASGLHFADNALEIGQYPEPHWITPFGVAVSWCMTTAIAVLALTRKKADTLFVISGYAYALVLLSGLLHYAFGSVTQMSARSNSTVVAEALAGAALMVAMVVTSLSGNVNTD